MSGYSRFDIGCPPEPERVSMAKEFAELDKVRIERYVLAERERCAGIVDGAITQMRKIMDFLVNEESWQFALNEMSDDVNDKFRVMQAIPYSISTLIRSQK
jgi:riboflavin synthase alpha subunit